MPQNQLQKQNPLPTVAAGQLLTKSSNTIATWAVTKTEKQLAVTFSEKKIAEYRNDIEGKDIRALITDWWVLHGSTRELTPTELKILYEWVRDNFDQLTYTDIHLAVQWSVTGELEIEHKPFLGLNADYISKVLRLYLERKQSLVQEIMERKRHRENSQLPAATATPQQNMQAMREMIITAYDALTTNEFYYDMNDMVYFWLRNTKQLVFNDDDANVALAYAAKKILENKVGEPKNIMESLVGNPKSEEEKKKMTKKYAREFTMRKYFQNNTLGQILSNLKLDYFVKAKT
jgi:hypothetical protein